MKKIFSIEFVKTRGLETLMIGALSLALASWLVTILDPYSEEEFAAIIWSFSFLSLASYKWMPTKGLWRSLVLPLNWAAVVTVMIVVLSEVDVLNFDEDYLFGQFFSFYVIIFLGNVFFKNQPVFAEIKSLLTEAKEKKNKPLVSIWLALAVISCVTVINHVSVSNAADDSHSRAEEAYDRADEAYERADEAYFEADNHSHY